MVKADGDDEITKGRNIMHKFLAMMMVGMLTSATLVNSAFCAPPPQYGWWDKGPRGEPQWRGSWGPHGRWMRHGSHWVYRSQVPMERR
jgi:hypothetical protein